MEQSKPKAIDENRTVKDYQTPLSRRKRFYDKSDNEGWYLETIDGGLKMPNEICALIETKTLCNFFFLKRQGEFFNARLFTIYNDGSIFFVSVMSGEICQNYQTLERYCSNAEYIDYQKALSDLMQQLKNTFNF